MVCSVLVFVCGLIFGIGYLIGYNAFKQSNKRVLLSVISGVTALVVTVGIVFAGCAVLLSNTSFH